MPRRIISEPRLGPVPEIASPDRKLLRLLARVPAKQVRCRSGKHKWASEEQEPGEPFPQEVVAHRQEGCYLIEDPCLRCGAVKYTLTGLGGDLYTARSWILYPHDWVTIPSEFPHGKATFKMEWNRLNKRPYAVLLRDADREHREVERERARRVRPVTFSGTG
jgi:hypothetical protein